MPHKTPTVSNAYTAVNQVKLISAGREYFNRLLQLIHEAEESIHLQAYIYDDDERHIVCWVRLWKSANRVTFIKPIFL